MKWMLVLLAGVYIGNLPFPNAQVRYCPNCERDAEGRIARSSSAIAQFERDHPCPSTKHNTGACPGYIVDHIISLACAGPDAPANMQWQSVPDAKAKDKWERWCDVSQLYAKHIHEKHP
jgi:hypothetical protein